MNSVDFTSAQLSSLGDQIAHQGVASANADLGRLLRAAARVGVSHHITDVLLDPREPEVARQRAFGRVAVALQNSIATFADATCESMFVRETVSV